MEVEKTRDNLNYQQPKKKDKPMSHQKIGDYLANLREAKNLKLVQISDYTKINLNVLKRLESTDFPALPSKAYVRGFVMSYIRAVKGNQKEALAILDKSYAEYQGIGHEVAEEKISDAQSANITSLLPTQAELKRTFGKVPQSVEPSVYFELLNKISSLAKNKTVTIPAAILFGFIVLALLITNYVKTNILENKTETIAAIEPEIKDKDSSLFVLEKAKELRGETTAAAPAPTTPAAPERTFQKVIEEIRALDIVVQTPEDLRNGRVVREKKEEDAGKYPYVKFSAMKTSDLFETIADAPENSDPELIPDVVKEAYVPGKQNVFVRSMNGESWLTYKIENKEVKSLVLRQGKALFLQGDQIQLFMGNVNVTKIFYNNQLMKIDSRSGVKSLIFPKENSSNFILPLFVQNTDGVLFTAQDYQKLMDEKPEE
ncbi:MAG: helix-turn-helix domain-containing protein [Bacteriovoracaceae bacterium]|nr:helix-turn-helix domain-containing protein [Bacteriovoracaceae bacterium]